MSLRVLGGDVSNVRRSAGVPCVWIVAGANRQWTVACRSAFADRLGYARGGGGSGAGTSAVCLTLFHGVELVNIGTAIAAPLGDTSATALHDMTTAHVVPAQAPSQGADCSESLASVGAPCSEWPSPCSWLLAFATLQPPDSVVIPTPNARASDAVITKCPMLRLTLVP